MSGTERPNILSGLIELHREIAGRIDHARRQLEGDILPWREQADLIFRFRRPDGSVR